MNHRIKQLQPYPFEKLNSLKAGLETVNLEPIILSLGEPKHPAPDFILQALIDNFSTYGNYPKTKGLQPLRDSIESWLAKRFNLKQINQEQHILPVNGTREALFAFAQTVLNEGDLVILPNPFYQIYEGAALLAGANIKFLDLTESNNFQPDFSSISQQQWQQCKLIYICSPHNPTGSILNKQTLENLIRLAQKYDFIIASDECYSEIYFDEAQKPLSLLEVAEQMGIKDYSNCVVFHSLSKRSNLPGFRSGFVAGDCKILSKFLLYRTYHGSAMPPPTQMASVAAWNDEQHVIENRKIYRQKFKQVLKILQFPVHMPDGGFYLWIKTPINDVDYTLGLFQQQNVTVVPGSFLSRGNNGFNPGNNFVRVALVANLEECIIAAKRINLYHQALI